MSNCNTCDTCSNININNHIHNRRISPNGKIDQCSECNRDFIMFVWQTGKQCDDGSTDLKSSIILIFLNHVKGNEFHISGPATSTATSTATSKTYDTYSIMESNPYSDKITYKYKFEEDQLILTQSGPESNNSNWIITSETIYLLNNLSQHNLNTLESMIQKYFPNFVKHN